MRHLFTYLNGFKIYKLVLLGFFMFLFQAKAQTEYKMSNAKVYACKGSLKDSEANQQSTTKYANNEDLIFTIIVKGASSISIKFKGSFCTEAGSDYLKAYRGRDTTGTLIRTYTGTINNPTNITSNDSAITFYFHSDKNIVCDGWELTWEGKITQVPQPKFSPITNPTCNSNKIRVTLDQPFNCDSVKASSFKLSGTLSTAITSVTPISCNSKNETNTFDVSFASGLNRSGNYSLLLTSSFKDACDSVWVIKSTLNFKITDCPIQVDLRSNRLVICKGTCANLTAIISGGNASSYSYTWLSGGLSSAPPQTVCPTVTTTYILRVSDGVSVPGYDTVVITVLDPPVAQNDTTVCQSSPSFNLKANPSGGVWSGTGITSASNGTFSPSLARGGTFKIAYSIGGCADTVVVIVRPISAGTPLAACPSSSAFMVSGFTPPGGTWSGPNISAAGLITPPSSSGSFTVTYSWNGCTSDKIINIDLINIVKRDTICKSKAIDTFKNFTPVGGNWTGPGITNARLGISTPPTAAAGNKIYIYTINGCRDTLRRFIQEIDARFDEIACPDAGQRLLPQGLPVGGYWTGKGIFDANNGLFDADSFRVPSKSTFVQSNLTYHGVNGCKDVKIMFLRYTRFYKDTVKNCISDTAYFMRNAYLQNDPWNMMFTGSNAIVGSSVYNQKFSPTLAGRGTFHTIIGTANGCQDTIVIQVYNRANIQKDTVLCIADDPYQLRNGEGAGLFFGPGITNAQKGIFNPAIAGVGTHLILFNLPGKCTDTVKIKVNGLPNVSILGLRDYYCYKDSITQLVLNPVGGLLQGIGLVGTAFNPSKANQGVHRITYTFGSGKCISTFSKDVTVGEPLTLTLSKNKDSICIGETVELSTLSKGGNGNSTLVWSSGQLNVPNIYEAPKRTTQYNVVLKDGCSDSVQRQTFIYVHQPLFGWVQTSTKMCFGNQGFAELKMNDTGRYSYTWNTIPIQKTSRIVAPVATTYKVKVKNLETNCFYDTSVTIPGYDRIRAFFTTVPSSQCLYSNNALLKIINASEGGTSGIWDFGDGNTDSYDEQTNPTHLYKGDTDRYEIKLFISNEGGCKYSFKASICILDTVSLFVPDAFTPNDDEINDVFKIHSLSIVKIDLKIFNRWGELLFETNDPKKGWNGFYKEKLCPTDYYIYQVKYKGKTTPWKYKNGVFYLLR
jgi:gliding motility-associated-like protein